MFIAGVRGTYRYLNETFIYIFGVGLLKEISLSNHRLYILGSRSVPSSSLAYPLTVNYYYIQPESTDIPTVVTNPIP